ncbi:hypothetical protein V8E51_006484 [Hyaloscypha variabilis]
MPPAMEDQPKRYFVVSSMGIHPSAVKVGSIITNLNFPDIPLSTFIPIIEEEFDPNVLEALSTEPRQKKTANPIDDNTRGSSSGSSRQGISGSNAHSRKKKRDNCTACKKGGHLEPDCYIAHPEKKEEHLRKLEERKNKNENENNNVKDEAKESQAGARETHWELNRTNPGSKMLYADTPLYVTVGKAVGDITKSRGWGGGVFGSFLKQLIQGLKISISISKSGSNDFWYSVEELKTSTFAPSPKYVDDALKDIMVDAHFKQRGTTGRAYLITSVRVARQLIVVRKTSGVVGIAGHAGLEIPPAWGTVGPKVWYGNTGREYHKEEYEGPIVFAYSVEQIRLTKQGKPVREPVITGNMMGVGHPEDEDFKFVIEPEVDAEVLENFELRKVEVVDENNEKCDIFVEY